MADREQAIDAIAPASDFNFLNGAWQAVERWLPRCGEGSDDWKERRAYLIQRPMLGGTANAEEITYPDEPDFAVATFRCFDSPSGQWIIQSYVYGAKGNMPGMFEGHGVLIPAMRGRFDGKGRGEFVGSSEYEGRAVRCKYVWHDITAISARWQRWFSFDDGSTWELNVTWALTRERTMT